MRNGLGITHIPQQAQQPSGAFNRTASVFKTINDYSSSLLLSPPPFSKKASVFDTSPRQQESNYEQHLQLNNFKF